jgi:hypothetical protein
LCGNYCTAVRLVGERMQNQKKTAPDEVGSEVWRMGAEPTAGVLRYVAKTSLA